MYSVKIMETFEHYSKPGFMALDQDILQCDFCNHSCGSRVVFGLDPPGVSNRVMFFQSIGKSCCYQCANSGNGLSPKQRYGIHRELVGLRQAAVRNRQLQHHLAAPTTETIKV